MNNILFTVEGVRGQGRPRANYKTGHLYEDSKDKEYKEKVKTAYIKQVDEGEMAFPKGEGVDVLISIHVALPKSYSKKRKAEIMANGEKPLVKPDLDNVAKIILDSLNGIAWADDSQVTSLWVKKQYDPNIKESNVLVMLSSDKMSEDKF